MQTYMDMLNPDVGADTPKREEPATPAHPPPPPAFPPPPPPLDPSKLPPPPPGYPAPLPPEETPSADMYLKVKSNLRHVESDAKKVSCLNPPKRISEKLTLTDNIVVNPL